MPNPWTGKGNPYTREEVIERLQDTLGRGEPIIAAGAGTGAHAAVSPQPAAIDGAYAEFSGYGDSAASEEV